MTGWVGWNKYKTVNLYVNGVLINTANLFPTAHNSSASDTEKQLMENIRNLRRCRN